MEEVCPVERHTSTTRQLYMRAQQNTVLERRENYVKFRTIMELNSARSVPENQETQINVARSFGQKLKLLEPCKISFRSVRTRWKWTALSICRVQMKQN